VGNQASSGASDYGNKFGEPMVAGYTRSFGMRLKSGERREWVKPIMFTAGLGSMDSRHMSKDAAEKGFLIAKIGGPAYRIGMGGGSVGLHHFRSPTLSQSCWAGLPSFALVRSFFCGFALVSQDRLLRLAWHWFEQTHDSLLPVRSAWGAPAAAVASEWCDRRRH
jgi:hypothetical protein